MKLHRWLFLAATAAGLLVSSPASHARTMEFLGEAHNNAKELVYREQHRVEGECVEGVWRPLNHTVDYLPATDQAPFATKSMRYDDSLIRPTVSFDQTRWNQSLAIETGAGRVSVQLSDQGENETFQIAVQDSLVIDAGFDHFVRQHWDTLVDGGAVYFRFLAPTRGESYDFVLEPQPRPRDDYYLNVRIRPAGFIMRMLVDPIELGYDRNGFLAFYSGLTNIQRDEEQNYIADIHYTLNTPPVCPLIP